MLIEVSYVMELWNNYYDFLSTLNNASMSLLKTTSLKGISMLYLHLKRLDVNGHVLKFSKDFVRYAIQALNY